MLGERARHSSDVPVEEVHFERRGVRRAHLTGACSSLRRSHRNLVRHAQKNARLAGSAQQRASTRKRYTSNASQGAAGLPNARPRAETAGGIVCHNMRIAAAGLEKKGACPCRVKRATSFPGMRLVKEGRLPHTDEDLGACASRNHRARRWAHAESVGRGRALLKLEAPTRTKSHATSVRR
jgi:hypothetical protein